VISGVRVISNSDYDIHLRIDTRPDAILFTGAYRSTLSACVCTQCGYTELFLQDPEALLAAYQESQKNLDSAS
jgi:hypothetical protein